MCGMCRTAVGASQRHRHCSCGALTYWGPPPSPRTACTAPRGGTSAPQRLPCSAVDSSPCSTLITQRPLPCAAPGPTSSQSRGRPAGAPGCAPPQPRLSPVPLAVPALLGAPQAGIWMRWPGAAAAANPRRCVLGAHAWRSSARNSYVWGGPFSSVRAPVRQTPMKKPQLPLGMLQRRE